ncbi:hypothetical protein TrVE_jg2518 [Triparma verrucosa]|uniref:Uncharacterized protein n=1 Tax=Triparma verrucosa TaxID=1606542 RepID=A0A9W7F644_9STRA|nr:hypothetical protein TrVE_jg2518 [Triparma verrucosa]
MFKRMHEVISNALEVAIPNDLADVMDDTESSEGSKEPDCKESAAVVGVVKLKLTELEADEADVYGYCEGNCGAKISNQEAKSPCDFGGCEHYVGYCFLRVADCGGMDELHRCTKTTCDNFDNYYCKEHGVLDGCSYGCFDDDDEDGYNY